MKIHLEYYALLRERAGKNAESLETPATTAEDLYRELKARYGFPLDAGRVTAAINAEHAPMSSLLKENDTVVFIAPISGG